MSVLPPPAHPPPPPLAAAERPESVSLKSTHENTALSVTRDTEIASSLTTLHTHTHFMTSLNV